MASRTGAVVSTPTAGISQEPFVRSRVVGEAFQCKCEVMQDEDLVNIAPLGLSGDEVARAEVGLAAFTEPVRRACRHGGGAGIVTGGQRRRRGRPHRQPARRILVVTEGTRTDPQYVEGLNRYLRSNGATAIVKPVSVGKDPLKVMQ